MFSQKDRSAWGTVLKYKYSFYKLNKQIILAYFWYFKTNKQSLVSELTANFDMHINYMQSYLRVGGGIYVEWDYEPCTRKYISHTWQFY